MGKLLAAIARAKRGALARVPKGRTKGTYWWHIHHEPLIELATENIVNRIDFIEYRKGVGQKVTRFQRIRPVKSKAAVGAFKKLRKMGLHKEGYVSEFTSDERLAKLAPLVEVVLAAHKKECPRCPWKKNHDRDGRLLNGNLGRGW